MIVNFFLKIFLKLSLVDTLKIRALTNGIFAPKRVQLQTIWHLDQQLLPMYSIYARYNQHCNKTLALSVFAHSSQSISPRPIRRGLLPVQCRFLCLHSSVRRYCYVRLLCSKLSRSLQHNHQCLWPHSPKHIRTICSLGPRAANTRVRSPHNWREQQLGGARRFALPSCDLRVCEYCVILSLVEALLASVYVITFYANFLLEWISLALKLRWKFKYVSNKQLILFFSVMA